jgi:hypothetical protein
VAGVIISIERAPIESSNVCAGPWRAGLVVRAAGSGKIRDVVINTCSDTIRVWELITLYYSQLPVVIPRPRHSVISPNLHRISGSPNLQANNQCVGENNQIFKRFGYFALRIWLFCPTHLVICPTHLVICPTLLVIRPEFGNV